MPKHLFQKGNKYAVGIKYWQGKSRPKETREKIRETLKRKGIIPPSNLGKKFPLDIRIKMGQSRRGENNPNWKGGITLENKLIRERIEYKLWHEAVFGKDNWTCQKCGQRNYKGLGRTVKLEAHHIFSFNKYPELRLAINNGLTLCKKCHKEIHKSKCQ